jgi:tetratricopeptide (TPR) repeat protein
VLGLPDQLASFLVKCLDREARVRYQSWDAVEAELIKLHDLLLNQRVQPEIALYDVSQKSQLLMGETILSIGKAYLDIQEFQAAVRCFERARAIGKLQNYFRLVTQSEANIALAFFSLGKHEQGSAHYRRAMAQQKWSKNRAFTDLINDYFDTIYYPPGEFSGEQKKANKPRYR